MNITIFGGELTDISAKTKALWPTYWFSQPDNRFFFVYRQDVYIISLYRSVVYYLYVCIEICGISTSVFKMKFNIFLDTLI